MPIERRPEPDVLEFMRRNVKPGTRWAAYENADLGHPDCGHLRFLAVGPQNTVKEAPRPRLPDFPGEINWRYQFVGFVNLRTEIVEEE